MYDTLMSPLKLGSVELANRICFLSHRTNFAESGRLTERLVNYYKARAEGGAGLIVFGELSVEESDRPFEKLLPGYREDIVPAYRRLIKAVRPSGCKLMAQLCHRGFQSGSAISRHVTLGPVAIADIEFGEVCKAMEAEDFKSVAAAFAIAAGHVKAAGLDGLVIDMGPESLLRQFLSNISNQRTDEYGGPIENLMRFPLEVVETVRETVGTAFTVGVELVADEMLWDGIKPEVAREITRRLCETDRIDFIIAGVGTYYNLAQVSPTMHTPFGFASEQISGVKQAASVPVIAAHHIESAESAQAMIQEKTADAVGLIRNLICDPEMPNKAKAGRPEEMIACARDNIGCIGRVKGAKAISCIQNPAVGFEGDRTDPPGEAAVKKKVLVIGGGPSGLEAARTAALRGHAVTLVEKEAELGGQINIHQKAAGRDRIAVVKDNLIRSLNHLKIQVKLNLTADEALIERENPEVVVVTTGSAPIEKPVAGSYGPPEVLTVIDVLEQRHAVGDRVLFIDTTGNHHATATVETLAEQGKQIDLVSCDLFVGVELANLGDLSSVRSRLLSKGVTFITDIRILNIEGKTAFGEKIYTHQTVTFDGYDTLILDMGRRAEDRLYKDLKQKAGDSVRVVRAGDCVAPRGIDMAIFEGRKIGESI